MGKIKYRQKKRENFAFFDRKMCYVLFMKKCGADIFYIEQKTEVKPS